MACAPNTTRTAGSAAGISTFDRGRLSAASAIAAATTRGGSAATGPTLSTVSLQTGSVVSNIGHPVTPVATGSAATTGRCAARTTRAAEGADFYI